MAKANRRNRTPAQRPSTAASVTPPNEETSMTNVDTGLPDPTPEEIVEEVKEETPPVEITPATPEVVGDTVTKKVIEPTPTVIAEETPPVVEENSSKDSTTLEDSDDSVISDLKIRLAAFKRSVESYGTDPEHFKETAKLSSGITKYIIKFPRKDVLDKLLEFFIENKDSVCRASEFMKGSTTLNGEDERRVGFLYNLFSDIANRRVVSVNPSLIINVLKRPEIVDYYNKKIAGIKANR